MGEERKQLEEMHGQVWSTDELTTDFKVESFAAPFVVCINKETGKKGTMMFQHRPRFYFGWEED